MIFFRNNVAYKSYLIGVYLPQYDHTSTNCCDRYVDVYADIDDHQRPLQYSYKLNKIIATSAKTLNDTSNGLVRKKYLHDLKPFYDVFGFKNVSNQILKAFALSSCVAIIEYNKHLDSLLRLQQSRQDIIDEYKSKQITMEEKSKKIQALPNIEEFDWNGLIQSKYFPLFYNSAGKFYFASFLRKVFEEIAVNNFPHRLTDKLTKDLTKSFYRKIARYSHTGSRFTASYMIFGTSMYASFFIYLSSLTSDVILSIAWSLKDLVNGSSTDLNGLRTKNHSWFHTSHPIMRSIIWFSKKILLVSGSLVGYSLGLAVGGYIGGVNYGAPFGSLIMEALFQALISGLIGA